MRPEPVTASHDESRPAPAWALPDAAALAIARKIIGQSSETYAYLALLGDKKLLFAPEGAGFVMFQQVGRSWVAMGDPVGPPSIRPALVQRFRDCCDQYDVRPVFYRIGAEDRHLYRDIGLTLSRLGEEGRVDLPTFDLEGSLRSPLRQDHRRAQRQGASFAVLPAAEVIRNIDALRIVSDEWLATRCVAEKGFSIGRFDPAYLANFPCAIVKLDGRIVAFGNLWCASDRAELAVDLMRHSNAAPKGVMEYLFVEAMFWGKQIGFHWFNLGMAPLSGLDQRPFASTWNRMGSFLFHHGEHFYNFEGLRRYKEKFAPEWRPRYLASPGGLAFPRVLMDVMALIAGSPRNLVMR